MEHTKGPWEIASYRNYFGFSVWSPHGPCIAERWYQHERSPEQNVEMAANARLIAAAPDLLWALKDVRDFLKRSGYDITLVNSVITKAEASIE